MRRESSLGASHLIAVILGIALVAVLPACVGPPTAESDPTLDRLDQLDAVVEIVGNELLVYVAGRAPEDLDRWGNRVESARRILHEATRSYIDDGVYSLDELRSLLPIVRDEYVAHLARDDTLSDRELEERLRRVRSAETLIRLLLPSTARGDALGCS